MSGSWATSEGTRRSMLANRRRDTKLELSVRRILHAHGLRYRVDARVEPDLRSRADIVFTRRKIAVFVDGCFWHRCPDHFVEPLANTDYWKPKLLRNQQRDGQVTSFLIERGWLVLRFWEHEPPELIAAAIEEAWRAALTTGGSPVTPSGSA